jgi:predicted proteasome-type protease
MARLQICLLMKLIYQAQTLLMVCTSGNLMTNVSVVQLINLLEKLRDGLGVRVYYGKRRDLYEHELGETSLSNQIRDGDN